LDEVLRVKDIEELRLRRVFVGEALGAILATVSQSFSDEASEHSSV
jgi:hypothetical protein